MKPDVTARAELRQGIRENRPQFLLQVLQVFLVGLTLGMTRTVVPALSEAEFGVPRGSFLMLGAFVVTFGIVKAVLNFAAGALSERVGRRRVLIFGWYAALPIPLLIAFAQNWYWIVGATMLLGVNQGLAWSVTQTAKLDLAHGRQRGLAVGLNEFGGYVGVAFAGWWTAQLAEYVGAREGILFFGAAVVVIGLVLSHVAVKETLPWARLHNATAAPPAKELFARVSWQDKRFMSLCQAGLVEKFVDALVWIVLPLHLYRAGYRLGAIGMVVGVYGVVWGICQLFAGRLSDRVGRKRLIVAGMFICGAATGFLYLARDIETIVVCAALMGFGMALLYPNLSAAVADLSEAHWRGTAIGVYRFWRDLGYAVGATAIGATAAVFDALDATFVFVAASMLASTLLVARYLPCDRR